MSHTIRKKLEAMLRDPKNTQAVLIRWIDSCQYGTEPWYDLEEKMPEVPDILSIGWLLKIEGDSVFFTTGLSENDDSNRIMGLYSIPLGCILGVSKLGAQE